MSSLSRKLLAPNVLLAVLISAALGLVAYEAAVRARAAEKDVDEVKTTNAYLAELNRLASEIQRNVLTYQIRPDDKLLSTIGPLDSELHHVMAEIGRAAIPARGTELWRELVATQKLLEEARNDLLAARRAGPVDRADPVVAKWHLAAEQRASLLADITAYNVTRLDQTIVALTGPRAMWLTILAVVIACSIALVVLSSANLTRMVLRPLASMTSTADRIATQQLALEVRGADRADEIGVLARAFNRMTTNLVDANKQLSEAVRARDEFISIASHELRTPLTSVKLHLSMASRRAEGSPGGTNGEPKWLGVSLRQLDRLEALIRSLLDVTRLRAGQLETQLEEVDLSELVESVVERFSTDLANCQTVARVELERGTIGRWDQERLDQVVTNLLANVMKYAPGAPVDVVVAKQDGFGILKVRDHGPGLTEEVRERAFDAFERASTTRSIGGLGLGLYIARGIVTAHGGTISVDSRPGEGAEFVVRLPLDRSGKPEAISTTPATKVESGATK